MPVIPVVWLHFEPGTINRGYWDQGFHEDLLHNRVWSTGYEFEHFDGPHLPPNVQDGAIVVFPARAQVRFVDKLNAYIAMFPWVIVMLTGDEESVFPVEKISHPNMRVWVMSPRQHRHDAYTKVGSGYPPHMRDLLVTARTAPEKDLDWFFAGQANNDRRDQCVEQLSRMTGGVAMETPGFTQGMSHWEYFGHLTRAKVAPCPSGPHTPDTFRFFEALEMGCVPIVDTRTMLQHAPDNYWEWFFGLALPFPVIRNWVDLPEMTRVAVEKYPALNNRVFAWWQRRKYAYAKRLSEQIKMLSGVAPSSSEITVLMPTSPASLHPSTEHIEQTMRDLRVHLPDADVVLMIDGVRPEMEAMRPEYEEYQRRLMWLCNYEWHNVLPVRFEPFLHQSGMTMRSLQYVTTPFLLFVEHDTPLTPDNEISFDACKEAIRTGQANVIRFHFEGRIPEEHTHLMIGEPEDVCGVPMLRTSQWSQRPHLASTAFYRWMMETQFREESRAFIEHGAYGAFLSTVQRDGVMGWNLWKLWIYFPDGHIKRSYDLNSRAGGPNYESVF